MNKMAKPLYTDPEDIKNYENRKRIRRNFITAIGGVGGGLTGASIGGGIGMGSAGPLSRSSGRRALLGALLGLGVGATAGALGGRKLNDLSVGYMESAGLDPTIPNLKAKLQKDAAAKAAEARNFTTARRNTMNKTAAHRSIARRAFLTKAAGVATDYLATLPSQALAHSGIPIVSQLGALANLGGAIGGLVTDPEKEKNPKTDALSLVPGVGAYRLSQRSRRVMDESNRRGARGTANLVAEAVGPITSSIIGAGAGGALGGALGSLRRDALGRTKAAPGAAVGAIAGGVLPVLVGSIAAGIRRKRTLDEQAAADTKGRAVAKYLVPGLAQYDSLKRLGASSHLDDKSKKTDKKEKKAAEAAYAEGFCKAAEIAGVDPGELAKAAAGSSDHSTANLASEVAGFMSPTVLGVLARRALLRGKPGAAIAAGLAGRVAGFANLAGAVTGLAKDTRSNAAQAAYDSGNHVLKNLLPGVGGYNMWKRIGNKMRGE